MNNSDDSQPKSKGNISRALNSNSVEIAPASLVTSPVLTSEGVILNSDNVLQYAYIFKIMDVALVSYQGNPNRLAPGTLFKGNYKAFKLPSHLGNILYEVTNVKASHDSTRQIKNRFNTGRVELFLRIDMKSVQFGEYTHPSTYMVKTMGRTPIVFEETRAFKDDIQYVYAWFHLKTCRVFGNSDRKCEYRWTAKEEKETVLTNQSISKRVLVAQSHAKNLTFSEEDTVRSIQKGKEVIKILLGSARRNFNPKQLYLLGDLKSSSIQATQRSQTPNSTSSDTKTASPVNFPMTVAKVLDRSTGFLIVYITCIGEKAMSDPDVCDILSTSYLGDEVECFYAPMEPLQEFPNIRYKVFSPKSRRESVVPHRVTKDHTIECLLKINMRSKYQCDEQVDSYFVDGFGTTPISLPFSSSENYIHAWCKLEEIPILSNSTRKTQICWIPLEYLQDEKLHDVLTNELKIVEKKLVSLLDRHYETVVPLKKGVEIINKLLKIPNLTPEQFHNLERLRRLYHGIIEKEQLLKIKNIITELKFIEPEYFCTTLFFLSNLHC